MTFKLNGERRKQLTIIGLGVVALLAAIVILFVGYGLGRSSGYFDAQSDGYAAQYQEETADQVRRCLAGKQAPASIQECVEKAVEASHENQRDERDLSAQRQMAQWAWWLLIVTMASVPLTAVGLIFLLITIWQGREALALQKGETRPWLSFKNLKVRYLHIHQLADDGGWMIQPVVEVEIVNSGGMPAGEVRAFAQAIDNPISTEAPAEVEWLVKGQIPTNRGLAMGILPPDGVAEFKSPAAPYGLPLTDGQGASIRDVFPGILLSVIYRAIGSAEVHQTAQVFRLSYGDPDQHTDNHAAMGFWLAHKSYEPKAITITAGSKMDRAT